MAMGRFSGAKHTARATFPKGRVSSVHMTEGCAPDETIAEFLEGTLEGPQLEALEAHLDGCEQCGPRLLALAREHHQLSGATPEGGLLARGSSVGRFVILEVIGRGSYGTVHTAYDPQLDRRLALKVLDAWSLDEPEQLALVQHEARGMAKVSHPNVVSIHDAGVVGGVPTALEAKLSEALPEVWARACMLGGRREGESG